MRKCCLVTDGRRCPYRAVSRFIVRRFTMLGPTTVADVCKMHAKRFRVQLKGPIVAKTIQAGCEQKIA